MPLNCIVACDLNNGIGLDNTIPWYLPEDLQYFKATTLNSTVVMGRKTFLSLQNKPLPNRKNIVITSNKENINKDNLYFMNINQFKKYLENNNENIFIIGGENLYNEFMNYCEYIYITKIYCNYSCDKYFNYKVEEFVEESVSEIMYSKNENIKYQFTKLKRI